MPVAIDTSILIAAEKAGDLEAVFIRVNPWLKKLHYERPGGNFTPWVLLEP
jgi:hypothetical protein